MRNRSLAGLLSVLLLLPSCSLIEQLTASRIVIASMLYTPELSDPNLPEALPARVDLTVSLSDRGTGAIPTPVSGAKVKLIYPLAPEGIFLAEQADLPGNYLLSSDPNSSGFHPDFEYVDEQEYRLQIEDTQDIYVMEVTLPRPSQGSDLDATTTKEIPRGVGLPIAHPDSQELAFITVTRAPDPFTGCLDVQGSAITFSNVPDAPDEAIKLINDDGEWKSDPLQIPGSAFPGCGLYTVIVSTMARGTAETTNLFVGSQFLAGKAEGALYRVR